MTMKKRSGFSPLTLLGRASALALAVGCGAGLAQVQKAIQGTPTVVSGDAFISQGTASGTIDTVSLNSSQAVIDWTPDDTSGTGAIDFLSAGKTVRFSGFSNFTVLNRVLPADISRAIGLNGTVESLVGGSTGGSVWFYAPGGIIAGVNSVFSVGSLLLTSNDIDTTGGLFDPVSNAIRFRGASNVLSSVEVRSGAQINALSAGSYVALVAPRVVQGGTVTVNGTAAYVGAEQADITISGGLFDINILAGTTDANGVVHSGTTARVDTTTSSDAQRVYMVAVPKNNALTMLLSGNIGYHAADAVVQDGSAVILSAGHDVFGNFIGAPEATATAPSSISIGASTWQPNVTGAATGAITLRANAGEAITAGGDVNLTAGGGATGGRIDLLTFGGSGSAATNGRIAVTGALNLDASGELFSGQTQPPAIGENARGGEINLIAAGGSISAASLDARANATSGAGSSRSGDAVGGRINLTAGTAAGPSGTEAGSLSFGSVALKASAQTGFGYYFSSTVDGGNALGGTIDIAAAGGSFSASDLFADVGGEGGSAMNIAGTGTGGNIILSASSAGGLRGSFALTNCSFRCGVYATGQGGEGTDGATGTGGSILLQATDADFTVTGDLNLSAQGTGGGTSYYDGVAGRGGDGVGGTVTVESRAGVAGSAVMRFDGLYLSADGVAGNSIDGISFNDGNAGNGTGGTISLLVAGGDLTAGLVDANAGGRGGAAGVNCPTCDGGGTT
ncbi:MAG TPA: histidine kinase, partial [Sphingobium sp.]|nr:histidine kinase [Sphingobium sp.]